MEDSIVVQATGLLQDLVGPNDANLHCIERLTGAEIIPRGNELLVQSDDDAVCELVHTIFDEIQRLFFQGRAIDPQLITAIYHGHSHGNQRTREDFQRESLVIPGGFQPVFPRTLNQSHMLKLLVERDINFVIGPAGTGKTFLAIAYALQEILEKKYRKLILSRPVVEAGESLGFLPGDLTQKLHPYLKPLYDAMETLVPREILQRLHDQNLIEVSPLAYMRGRSLNNCYIILDEAQNTTVEQMKMFLTRMGEHSKVVVTGDVTQIDLPKPHRSGLVHALRTLQSIDEIGVMRFTPGDVVRHPLVQKIITAYTRAEEENGKSG
ncbi:PhoH family protein [Spirochaeta africana]|uniref:PhoH-like protein n=1 Tax=Spirochaeta africana (strain ATCC 700263 / DSM 8902 / Z-7692) TaxID=889378 RepID=H9UJK2_SPIAZ|nr:PhoH family protein [Spirochaeta africana]AFG37695.1 phosphate starvation-inducible protein PhoH, predicted ATPase [Spirochaeta africana DSM 8902]